MEAELISGAGGAGETRRGGAADRVDKGVVGAHADLGDALHVVGHGRREEQRLARLLGRQSREHVEDGGAEAHVEQLVGLIQDQHAQAQHHSIQPRALEVIVQPPRRCHQQVRRRLEAVDVLVHVGAAVDAHELKA